MKARPYLGLHCADCTIGTSTLNEYYIVHDNVWEQAWAGRRKSWHTADQEILCIGCLEQRIGRTLTRHDFPHDVPCNRWDEQSARLRDRFTAEWPPKKVTP